MSGRSGVTAWPDAAEAIAAASGTLRAAAVDAAGAAKRLGRPILVCARSRISPVDPLDLFDAAPGDAADRVFWEQPSESLALAGVGSAWTFVGEGGAPIEDASAAWRSCLRGAFGLEGAEAWTWGTGPVALGGFAFSRNSSLVPSWDGYPPGKMVLPRLTVSRIGREGWLNAAVMVEPEGDGVAAAIREIADLAGPLAARTRQSARPPASAANGPPAVEEHPGAEAWKAAVRRAAQAARDGVFTKVVLARAVVVRGVQADVSGVLQRLRDGYSRCTLFAVAAGGRYFLGATPERLVRVRRGEVSAAAVAGSIPRGATGDEDRRLGEMLLANPKERLEHAVVVDVVKGTIAEVCVDVESPPVPELLKVANVQHLSTPMRGRLRDRLDTLELVDRLHPTPAVGGFPRAAALRWIGEHEGLDRGWYAGPIGWIDHAGEGEFAVAIRSAILQRSEAVLYAGCGIVADSDPEQEYAESMLKLRPMLEALGVDRTGQSGTEP